jgi:hypothetical protein
LEVSNVQTAAAVHRKFGVKAEPGGLAAPSQHFRAPYPTCSRLSGLGSYGVSAAAAAEHQRDEQQEGNFLHESSLSFESNPEMQDLGYKISACKITEMQAGWSMDVREVTIRGSGLTWTVSRQ